MQSHLIPRPEACGSWSVQCCNCRGHLPKPGAGHRSLEPQTFQTGACFTSCILHLRSALQILHCAIRSCFPHIFCQGPVPRGPELRRRRCRCSGAHSWERPLPDTRGSASGFCLYCGSGRTQTGWNQGPSPSWLEYLECIGGTVNLRKGSSHHFVCTYVTHEQTSVLLPDLNTQDRHEAPSPDRFRILYCKALGIELGTKLHLNE